MLPAIRAARPEDAPAIARLHRAIWPEDWIDIDHIAGLIERGQRATHVACAGPEIVGYADGFLTRAQDNTVRWEVNQLAVDPAYRNQGTGARLIDASLIAGRVRRAHVARALVRVTNVASQRAFARADFQPLPDHATLVVSTDPVLGDPEPPRGLHLVPVWTFTYRGFWLEGNLSLDSFYAGQRYRMVFDADLAGAVVPGSSLAALEAAHAAGYETVGVYQWWHCPLI